MARQSILIVIVIMMILSSQNVHTFEVISSRGNFFIGLKDNFKTSSTSLYAAKKVKKSHPAVPEFSRVLNVGQVSLIFRIYCLMIDILDILS